MVQKWSHKAGSTVLLKYYYCCKFTFVKCFKVLAPTLFAKNHRHLIFISSCLCFFPTNYGIVKLKIKHLFYFRFLSQFKEVHKKTSLIKHSTHLTFNILCWPKYSIIVAQTMKNVPYSMIIQCLVYTIQKLPLTY